MKPKFESNLAFGFESLGQRLKSQGGTRIVSRAG
jgi:hypothetical protein